MLTFWIRDALPQLMFKTPSCFITHLSLVLFLLLHLHLQFPHHHLSLPLWDGSGPARHVWAPDSPRPPRWTCSGQQEYFRWRPLWASRCSVRWAGSGATRRWSWERGWSGWRGWTSRWWRFWLCRLGVVGLGFGRGSGGDNGRSP